MDDDKCGLYESSRTDSGFLSGGNLIVSEEITSEEQDSGVAKQRHVEEPYMHIDSGVDILSQTFSSLNLKHPDLNDLSCKDIKETSTKQRVKVEEQQWEIYYGQDEDGDT